MQAVHYIQWVISYIAMLSVTDAQKQQQKANGCSEVHSCLKVLMLTDTSLVSPRTDAEVQSGLSLYAGCQGVSVYRD